MQSTPRPVPGLRPRRINIDQYHSLAPEKIELLEGYLIRGARDHQARRDLLLLLLVNEGLQAAVRLAPAELWQEALRSVYQ